MTPEENKQLTRQLFKGIEERDYQLFDVLISPDYQNYGIPGTRRGPDGFKEIVSRFTDAFPDMKITFDQLIAEGDTVGTRGHWEGTHRGEFMGIPSSGERVRTEFIDFWKWKDGKAVENWVQMDVVGLMQQIGAFPQPA